MGAAPAFADLWEPLLPVGRDPGTGGYRRFSWTPADQACRAWFEAAARERQLRTIQDRNGNLWAWWDVAAPGRRRPRRGSRGRRRPRRGSRGRRRPRRGSHREPPGLGTGRRCL